MGAIHLDKSIKLGSFQNLAYVAYSLTNPQLERHKIAQLEPVHVDQANLPSVRSRTMSTATQLLEASREAASISGDPAGALGEMQLAFACYFVANGGNSVEAARAAGYSRPEVLGARCLANPKVLAHIKRLVTCSADAALPVAIATLLACCNDETASWKDRRNAALDLVKIAGAMPKEGHGVAVQVNVGGSAPASHVISSVWAARDARLSSIAAPMPDTMPTVIDATPTGPDPQRSDGAAPG